MKIHLDYSDWRDALSQLLWGPFLGFTLVAGAPTVPPRQPSRSAESGSCFYLPDLAETDWNTWLKIKTSYGFALFVLENSTKYPGAEKALDQTVLSEKGR